MGDMCQNITIENIIFTRGYFKGIYLYHVAIYLKLDAFLYLYFFFDDILISNTIPYGVRTCNVSFIF